MWCQKAACFFFLFTCQFLFSFTLKKKKTTHISVLLFIMKTEKKNNVDFIREYWTDGARASGGEKIETNTVVMVSLRCSKQRDPNGQWKPLLGKKTTYCSSLVSSWDLSLWPSLPILSSHIVSKITKQIRQGVRWWEQALWSPRWPSFWSRSEKPGVPAGPVGRLNASFNNSRGGSNTYQEAGSVYITGLYFIK